MGMGWGGGGGLTCWRFEGAVGVRGGSVGEQTRGGSNEGEHVLLESSVAIKMLHNTCFLVMDKLMISSETLLGEPCLCNNENTYFTLHRQELKDICGFETHKKLKNTNFT